MEPPDLVYQRMLFKSLESFLMFSPLQLLLGPLQLPLHEFDFLFQDFIALLLLLILPRINDQRGVDQLAQKV